MSIFDPKVYETMSVTEVNKNRGLLEPGDYVALIDNINSVQRTGRDGEAVAVINVTLKVEVPSEQRTNIGQSTVTLFDSIWLETNSRGEIDMGNGKNRRMKSYRDATDLNNPGKTFDFTMLPGRIVTVKVNQVTRKDNGDLIERVEGVAHA